MQSQFLWPPPQPGPHILRRNGGDSDAEDAQDVEELINPYRRQANEPFITNTPMETTASPFTPVPAITLNNAPVSSSTTMFDMIPEISMTPGQGNLHPSASINAPPSGNPSLLNHTVPLTLGSSYSAPGVRARSASPRRKRQSPRPSPDRIVQEDDRPGSAASKIRLVHVPDPQKDNLLKDLKQQLIASNQLLELFRKDFEGLKENTAAAKNLVESAEKRAAAAESALEKERHASEDRLRKFQEHIQEESSKRIHEAEKRAEATLKNIRTIELATRSQQTSGNTQGGATDMDCDEPQESENSKGKQREMNSMTEEQHSLAIQLPPPPRFPKPLKNTVAEARVGPISFKRPKSSGKPIAVPSLKQAIQTDDSEEEGSNSSSEGEMASTRKSAFNVSDLSGEELLKLLLKSAGVKAGVTSGSVRRRRAHPGLKQPARQAPRAKWKQDLMNWLRGHLHLLLNITKSRDILNFATEIYSSDTPAQRQMALWEDKKEGEGPKLKPMHINWKNFNGPWNTLLCELFVQYCAHEGLENGNPSDEAKDLIVEYFWDRLVRLRRILKKCRPKKDETEQQTHARTNGEHLQALNIARRNSRRNQKYHDRLDICLENLPENVADVATNEHDEWKKRYDVVAALGPEGVSSDETDEAEPDNYWVRRLPWRNKKLTQVVISIDDAKNTTNGYGNIRPGNRPRIRQRKRNAADSARKVPTGKPKNVYEPDWIATLNTVKKRALEMKSDVEFE